MLGKRKTRISNVHVDKQNEEGEYGHLYTRVNSHMNYDKFV